MSNHIESEDSELLMELSEQELDSVTGGRLHLPKNHSDLGFFFQQTNIQSFASSEANISADGASSKQVAAYTFSQTILAVGSLENVLGDLIGSLNPQISQ